MSPTMPRSRRWLGRLVLSASLGAALGAPASAQIAPETLLDSRGYATTMVQNRGTDVVDVTVELRYGSVTEAGVDLGDRVDALVSPAEFMLAPGDVQTVRILVREKLQPAEVVRLVTTIVPRSPAAVTPAEPDAGAQARLTFATRLVTKVIAQ
jgi:P pilus assembly chaperone PapD